MSISAERINKILQKTGGGRYLEIGVATGDTFFNVSAPVKVAVDPAFQFDPAAHEADGVFFYDVPSDDFFAFFESTPAAARAAGEDGAPCFDVIFIDGLHTFEQSYRDFVNSLRYAHDRTVWIIDDTIPNDSFSALPDADRCFLYRRLTGLVDKSWHGDVYKTVVAIHDNHKEFFFCTIVNMGNPQTVLWKASGGPDIRENVCRDMAAMDQLSYFDMAERAYALRPGNDMDLLDLIYTRAVNALSREKATELFFYTKGYIIFMMKEIARLRRQVEILRDQVKRLS